MKTISIAQEIVASSLPILEKYVPDKFKLTLDYVDIFPASEEEHQELLAEVKSAGVSVWPASTGNTYKLKEPIKTVKGDLHLLRIRIYDESKTVFRGHPDYAVEKEDYDSFKKKLLVKSKVRLIKRTQYEMVEIWDEDFDVAVYFPSIPLTEDVNKKLAKESK